MLFKKNQIDFRHQFKGRTIIYTGQEALRASAKINMLLFPILSPEYMPESAHGLDFWIEEKMFKQRFPFADSASECCFQV